MSKQTETPLSKLSVSERIQYSTVRIRCEQDGNIISIGTGFFFRFLEESKSYVPAIVTNRHVISGAKKGIIRLNVHDKSGMPILGEYCTLKYDDFESLWIPHPEDGIDLCIMPMSHILKRKDLEKINPFVLYFNQSLIPTSDELAELTAVEEILMIGYPAGAWDETNNLPIIRRGITATHPNVDYGGKREFVIDANCFAGSSGSPVLLYNVGGYYKKGGIFIMQSRVKLLGVFYAGFEITSTGELKVVYLPTKLHSKPIANIQINLGLVIKAEKLLDFNKVLQDLIH